MHAANGVAFQIDFDFVDHRLRGPRRNAGASSRSPSSTGCPSPSSPEAPRDAPAALGVDVAIQRVALRRADDDAVPGRRRARRLDADAVGRFWRILDWTDGVFEEFAGWFCGKTSPVHLFWHSFDLAVTRFGGKRALAMTSADAVTQEAYSHEVVSFGFWAGDQNVREPATTRTRHPSRPGCASDLCGPEAAVWTDTLALLPRHRGRSDSRRSARDVARLPRERVRSRSRRGGGTARVSSPRGARPRPDRRGLIGRTGRARPANESRQRAAGGSDATLGLDESDDPGRVVAARRASAAPSASCTSSAGACSSTTRASNPRSPASARSPTPSACATRSTPTTSRRSTTRRASSSRRASARSASGSSSRSATRRSCSRSRGPGARREDGQLEDPGVPGLRRLHRRRRLRHVPAGSSGSST